MIDEALTLHQNGELNRAGEIYRSVIELNPLNFDALNLLGLVHYQSGRVNESIELFKQAIGLYPANVQFYFNLARSLEDLNREQDALSIYQEAIKLDNNYIDAYLRAGWICQKLQKPEPALNFFDTAVLKDPYCLNGYLAKSSLLSAQHQFEKAVETLIEAQAIITKAPELHLNLGIVYEDRSAPGDLELAIASYSKAIELREGYVSAIFNRGNAYQRLTRWDQAIEDYQKVNSLDQTFAPAFANLGLVYYKQALYSQAISSFERALELDPTHAQTYSNLGVVLYESKRFLEALVAYDKAIEYKPDYSEAFSNRGNVLKELRQFDTALQSYDKAIAFRQDYFEAFVNRGVVYFELNRLEEAMRDYDKAIASQSNYATAFSNRSNVFKEQGQLSSALPDIKTAVLLKFNEIKDHAIKRHVLPQKPMLVQDAAAVLLELQSLLDKHSIPFFLAYGTLLGIYRDSELLPHDKDLDVGVDWNCSRDNLIAILRESGQYWIDPKSSDPKTYEFNFGVIDKKRGISIDFFFFKPEGEYLLSGFHHLPDPLLWKFNRFDLGEIVYRGRTFKVPLNPESFLVDIYGPNWRIPDPYFDSLVTGYNLTETSKPLSLIYAYSRLFDYLMEQNWKKAYGYCVQIEAFEQERGRNKDLMAFLELYQKA